MRRLSPRNCMVAGALSISIGIGYGATGLVGAHAAEDPGSGLQSYFLDAIAGGVQFLATGPTGQAAGSADGAVPYAQSTLRYGPTGHALTSLFWPGALGGNLGTLLLVAGIPTGSIPNPLPIPLPPPPDIPEPLKPYLPYLNDPIRAEANTASGPETVTFNEVPGVSMVATAKQNKVDATTEALGLINAVVGNTGIIKTHTTTTLQGATGASSEAYSTVSDLKLGGGVITISSVTSIARVSTDGKVGRLDEGGTVVSGAKVDGVPVTIDATGIHVNGQGTSLGVLTDTVNTVLKNAGISIFLSKDSGRPDPKKPSPNVDYTAGSLVIAFPQNVVINIGAAHSTVSASIAGSYGGGGFTPPVVSGGGTTSPTTPGTTGGTLPNPGNGTVQPAPGGITGPAPAIAPQNASNIKLPGGIGWGWIVFVLLGGAFFAVGLRRLPDQVLAATSTPCNLGERA